MFTGGSLNVHIELRANLVKVKVSSLKMSKEKQNGREVGFFLKFRLKLSIKVRLVTSMEK